MNPTSPQNVDSITTLPPITEARSLHRNIRRNLILEIEATTGRTLLCYVTRHGWIQGEDIRYMQELLYTVDQRRPLDLLLNSRGGNTSTAIKLVHMIWNASSDDQDLFRLIVPDEAKSAATLVALGANEIIMSSSSELGPIDPQLQDVSGNWYSVFDYISSYESAETNYRKNPHDPAYRMTFEAFDPVRFKSLQQLTTYTRQSAENLLKRHGGNYTLAPTRLMDTGMFPSHEHVIDSATAKNDLDLNVKFLNDGDDLWRLYWKLYCHLQEAVGSSHKIFESSHVSLLV